GPEVIRLEDLERDQAPCDRAGRAPERDGDENGAASDRVMFPHATDPLARTSWLLRSARPGGRKLARRDEHEPRGSGGLTLEIANGSRFDRGQRLVLRLRDPQAALALRQAGLARPEVLDRVARLHVAHRLQEIDDERDDGDGEAEGDGPHPACVPLVDLAV